MIESYLQFKTKDLINIRSGWTECFPINMLDTLKEEFERLA